MKRLGMLTPSSNTVLEPMTSAIMATQPNISVHFSRLRVTEISVEAKALAQFHGTPMLEAAALLADARPNAIIWNGTSGGWTGLDADRGLVAILEERLQVPVSTVTLALIDALGTKTWSHNQESENVSARFNNDIHTGGGWENIVKESKVRN